MLISQLMNSLFPSGGETHSYDEIRNWCAAALGLTEQQIKGVVGYLVAHKMLFIATNVTSTQSAIFTH